jgi:hypothetical protein
MNMMMHELAKNLIAIGNQEMNQKRCAFLRKQQHSLATVVRYAR